MYKLFSLFLVFFMTTSLSEARFATKDDAHSEILSEETIINLNKDGTYTKTEKCRFLVKTESARERLGTMQFTYCEDNGVLEIVTAQAIIDGVAHPISKDKIERKPIASNAQGFSDIYQVMLSFPQIKSGTILEIETKYTETKPTTPNHFSYSYEFGTSHYTHAQSLKIISDIPLDSKVFDHNNYITLHKTQKNKKYIYEVTLQKPLYSSYVNESPDSEFPLEKAVSIEFSSFKSFQDLGDAFVKGYETILKHPLPEQLSNFMAEAKIYPSGNAQINFLTSTFADSIRYMGDWRTVKGRYAPRDIAEILSTGYGDCKDYATLLVKCLRDLGYTAHVALVNRGVRHNAREDSLPSCGLFNHAFVVVVHKNGDLQWIDPTNMSSMAQTIFPDIDDRYALILKPKSSELRKTTALNPSDNQMIRQYDLSIVDENTMVMKKSVDFIGIKALQLTGLDLVQPRQMTCEMIMRNLCEDPNHVAQDISIPEFSSRVVKNVQVAATFQQNNSLTRTSQGYGLNLTIPFFDKLFYIKDDQVADILLGHPESTKNTYVVKNPPKRTIKPEFVTIDSPWLSFERSIKPVGSDLEITETLTVKTKKLTAKDYKSKEFKDLVTKLRATSYKYVYVI